MSDWLDDAGKGLLSGELSRRDVLWRGGGALAGAMLFGLGPAAKIARGGTLPAGSPCKTSFDCLSDQCCLEHGVPPKWESRWICCDGVCCGALYTCCPSGRECCKNRCCGDNQTCCGDGCCSSECCGDECCSGECCGGGNDAKCCHGKCDGDKCIEHKRRKDGDGDDDDDDGGGDDDDSECSGFDEPCETTADCCEDLECVTIGSGKFCFPVGISDRALKRDIRTLTGALEGLRKL